MAVGDHLAGRRLRRRHHRNRAFRMAFVEVLRVCGIKDVEAEIKIGAAIGDLVRAVERRIGDLDIGDHRTTLLRQPGLVETDHVLALEARGVGQRRDDGHRSGAADAHDVNAETEAGVDFVHRVWKRALERRNAALLFLFRCIAGR